MIAYGRQVQVAGAAAKDARGQAPDKRKQTFVPDFGKQGRNGVIVGIDYKKINAKMSIKGTANKGKDGPG